MHTETSAHPERRHGQPAVPEDLDSLLTSAQLDGLDQALSFGWQLLFVRHPHLQDPTVVVTPDGGTTCATIDRDGELAFSPDLSIRH